MCRLAASSSYLGQNLLQLLLFYNWSRVVVVRDGTVCDLGMSGVSSLLTSNPHIELSENIYVNFSDQQALADALRRVNESARGTWCFLLLYVFKIIHRSSGPRLRRLCTGYGLAAAAEGRRAGHGRSQQRLHCALFHHAVVEPLGTLADQAEHHR